MTTLTWSDRLKMAIGPGGYDNGMRRSVQTVILYEAKRCVQPKLPDLRPFQRKAVFMETAVALLDSLDILYPHQKAEVFWRTATSKELLDAEISWKRVKSIEREMTNLSEKIKPFLNSRRSHDQAVDAMIQHMFEEASVVNRGKPFSANWPHAHNHNILCYRMYYRFDELDEDFPAPNPPSEVEIPETRPRPKAGPSPAAVFAHTVAKAPKFTDDSDEPALDVAAILGEGKPPAEERRKVLQEVREHLDLLKEFEGIISTEEIDRRKRELFESLPPAPPLVGPSPSKKPKAL